MEIALETGIPACQDTGVPVVFLEKGRDLSVGGPPLASLVDQGVAAACTAGWLRASMVSDPVFSRANTGDCTPASLSLEEVPGDGLRIRLLLRGAGSENASRSAMLHPGSGSGGVLAFVLESLRLGGSRACPPLILGIGIGGSLERCVHLARKALLRPFSSRNPDRRTAALEVEVLDRANDTGIGPQGFGGRTTALDARIESEPCHMASLPVAVCMGCYSHRTAERNL
jgi:fumarate hydratase subunit alpha